MHVFAVLLVKKKYHVKTFGCVLTAVGLASVAVTSFHLHPTKILLL